MSLSRAETRRLWGIVKQHYPPVVVAYTEFYVGNKVALYGHQDQPLDTLIMEWSADSLLSCCGFTELNALDFGKKDPELMGALLVLCLDDAEQLHKPAIIATTAATPQKRGPTHQEQVLLYAGFKAVHRGVNPSTTNQVTLWVRANKPSTITKAYTEVPRATTPTARKTSRRTR